MAAEFPGVDGVAPEFREGGFAEGFVLVLSQGGGHFGLAAGDQHDEAGLLGQGEANGVVGGGVAGVQGGDQVHPGRQFWSGDGFLDAQVEETHAGKAEFFRQFPGFLHQFRPGFDAVDVALVPGLEEQVVEDEAQVGFAGAVIGDAVVLAVGGQFGEQGFDEVVEVVHLLQLAPGVLVEFAVPGQDVQGLEQFDGLFRADFGDGGRSLGHGQPAVGQSRHSRPWGANAQAGGVRPVPGPGTWRSGGTPLPWGAAVSGCSIWRSAWPGP